MHHIYEEFLHFTNTTMSETNPALTIVRIFDAPKEQIWDAWSNPTQLMKWWGPAGFTSPSCTMDFRVGGKYHFCMRSPEGKDFWVTGTYEEIIPMEKLVYTDSFAYAEGNVVSGSYYGMEGMPLTFHAHVTFEDMDGKTKMTLVHEGVPENIWAETRDSWGSTFDKLAESVK